MTHATLERIRAVVDGQGLLTDANDTRRFLTDWTGRFSGDALAVVRPSSTRQVARVVEICHTAGMVITPQGGNTSTEGGAVPTDTRPGIVLSLERMNRIRDFNARARTATVEAGVILDTLRDTSAEQNLSYPVVFGSRGSCTLGGTLATNAGGSNVVRYGNTRDLCHGIEAVMPDGTVLNDLTGLRKDNTGYDLRHLLIGSEGTLGIITAAVVELKPAPKAHATAFVAIRDLPSAIELLNRIQDESGGLVEGFEFMPECMVKLILSQHPDLSAPLSPIPEVGILIELASTRDSDCRANADGSVPLVALLERTLAAQIEAGIVTDAVMASSEHQRATLWQLRESAFESVVAQQNFRGMDIAMPLDMVAVFLDRAKVLEQRFNLTTVKLAHLGDGNLHFVILARDGDSWDVARVEAFANDAYDIVQELNGSIAAEHGIGQNKRALLAARKDATALTAMRHIKLALDPDNIMNPGTLL